MGGDLRQSNISNINIFAVVFGKKDFRCCQHNNKINPNVIVVVLTFSFA